MAAVEPPGRAEIEPTQARQTGIPTAGPAELDCDVILAAQALSLNEPSVVVATSNVGHLARFVTAQDWQTIPAT